MSQTKENLQTARAYTVNDTRPHRPKAVRNGQELSYQERVRPKKQAQTLRIASLNVGSMTGRGREIADLMKKRGVDIMCVQETRWKGDKARELGDGYKIFYSGTNKHGRNGVGIILSEGLKGSVVEVVRKSDRLMKIKLSIGEELNVVSAYAPQIGCTSEEKEEFWNLLDEEMQTLEETNRVIVGGDLNGHIGKQNEGIERIHGGFGIGNRNQEGERIIDFAATFDLTLVNSFFNKRIEHLITYKSGGNSSQIDYLLYRKLHFKEVRNCKVIPSDHVTQQHRLLCTDLSIKKLEKSGTTKGIKKIKWFKLRKVETREIFKEKVLQNISKDYADVQDWWKNNAAVIRKYGKEILGETSGKIWKNKESWWWSNEVQEAVQKKKLAKKKWDETLQNRDYEEYKLKKKESKRKIAQAKAKAYQQMYDELETKEGQKKIYSIARFRNSTTKDITHVKHIKGLDNKILRKPENIKTRWEQYFKELLNVENERIYKENGQPNEGMTRDMSRGEVRKALAKVKNGKAVGPDGIPVEVWKALGEEGIDLLWDLFRKIYIQEEVPDEWRESTIVPIFKGKGDAQDCKNYRGIKLMSHTLKILERILDGRLREEVVISNEQFGFMPNRSTMDAIFSLRQLMEKFREKQKELHLVFIDLEKAYDRIPRQEIWRSLRERQVPEKYVRLIQEMYRDAEANVRSCLGETKKFQVKVGLHQGSALSPFLFNIIMDVVTEHVREEAPWNMLYADDIVLCAESKKEAEIKLKRWVKILEERGLKVSRSKTEYMCCNEIEGERKDLDLSGEKIKRVEHFRYLGSMMDESGDIEKEVNCRLQAGWKSWREVSGVLCDKKVPAKVKGKVYKTVVRPALMYGTETLPLKASNINRMQVMEMKMLRWMCGVTRKDRIRNEQIRGTTKVADLKGKIQESRLRWYGHVLRREEDYAGKMALNLNIEGKRKRGRPKKRWKELVDEDMKEKNLKKDWINDREVWRRLIKNSDPI